MKVTANIPDALVRQVESLAKGKNLTENLVIAISEWVRIKKLNQLHEKILKNPIRFQDGFTADKVRSLSRRKR